MLTHGGLFSDFFDNLRSLTVISLDLEDLGLSSRSLIWRVTRYSSHTYSTLTAYIEAFIANHSHQTLSSGQSLIWYAWLASTLAFWHYMRSGHALKHNPITTTTSAAICKGTRSTLTKNSYTRDKNIYACELCFRICEYYIQACDFFVRGLA